MIKILDRNTYYVLFCNKIQREGLKSVAYKRLLFLMENIKIFYKKRDNNFFNYFFTVLQVYVYIYKKKVGANIHQIPLFLRKGVRFRKGLSNFLRSVKYRKEKGFNFRLLNEMADIKSLKGSTIIARDNLYKTAIDEKSNIRFLKAWKKKSPLNLKKVFGIRN